MDSHVIFALNHDIFYLKKTGRYLNAGSDIICRNLSCSSKCYFIWGHDFAHPLWQETEIFIFSET